MPTSKQYKDYICEQLEGAGDVAFRAMMGEYIVYYKGKVIGGIYDDRLLVKPVPSAVRYIQNPAYQLPYDGAKPMLLVENVDDREYLIGLLDAMYDELPFRK